MSKLRDASFPVVVLIGRRMGGELVEAIPTTNPATRHAMYTVVSEVNHDMQIRQYAVDSPSAALLEHIGRMPLESLADFTDEQITTLHEMVRGLVPVELLEVTHCRDTWLWTSNRGMSDVPQPITCYIIATR